MYNPKVEFVKPSFPVTYSFQMGNNTLNNNSNNNNNNNEPVDKAVESNPPSSTHHLVDKAVSDSFLAGNPNLRTLPQTVVITPVKISNLLGTFSACEFRINDLSQYCQPFTSPLSIFKRIQRLQESIVDRRKYIRIEATLTNPELLITHNCIFVTIKKLGQGAQSSVTLTKRVSVEGSPSTEKVIKSSITSYSPEDKLLRGYRITDEKIDYIQSTYHPVYSGMNLHHLAVVDKSDVDLKKLDYTNIAAPVSFIAPRLHQIVGGLRVLHEKGLIHRDIKGANLLINFDKISKVTDTGLMMPKMPVQSKTACTTFYGAPFIWDDLYNQKVRLGYQDEKSDNFALGRTIFYDVALPILMTLGKRHKIDLSQLLISMKPLVHEFTDQKDSVSSRREFHNLRDQYPNSVIIINHIPGSRNKAEVNQAFIFPHRENLRLISLQCIEELAIAAPKVELDYLKQLLKLAYYLQNTVPSQIPTIQQVDRLLEPLTNKIKESEKQLPKPINNRILADTKNSPVNTVANDFAIDFKYHIRPKMSDSPFASHVLKRSFSETSVEDEENDDRIVPSKVKLNLLNQFNESPNK